MLRRSARRQAKDDAAEVTAPEPSAKAPPKKKSKKEQAEPAQPSEPKPKILRKKGKLRFITEVPLDVLLELFGYLLPLDILNLSRASKALRNILLSKSSLFVWKQAFLNVSSPTPPPCPVDLNLAQYTNLLWGKHCFVCGSAPSFTSFTMWPCRFRTCKNCVKEPTFVSVHPGSGGTDQSRKYDKVFRLCPSFYHCPERYNGQYVYLKTDLEAAQLALSKVEATGSEKAVEDFISQCQAKVKVKEQISSPCEWWKHNLKSARRNELRNIRTHRKDEILEKMESLGWTKELSDWSTKRSFMALPALRQSKELNERVWANIEPDLVAFLTAARSQRLERERRAVLNRRINIMFAVAQTYLDAIPISERPSNSDVCTLPEYRAILERPSEDNVTEDDFNDVLLDLPEHVQEWHNSKMNLLLELLPSTGSSKKKGKTPDVQLLDLCTTFFRCHSCREPISYPRILTHACLNKHRKSGAIDDEREADRDLLSGIFADAPWMQGYEGVAFDTEGSNITANLVKLCGQDPKICTTAAMDELDPRFECLQCRDTTAGRLVMTWRSALLHQLEDHYGESLKPKSYRLLESDEVIIAKEREAKSKKRPPPNLLCPKCNRPTPRTQAQMQEHLQWTHKGQHLEPVPYLDITIRQPPGPVRIK
ncbi:hypothetical protein R3P38DRAFT_2903806 [Favolaschia claudopus]|uniref:F-box domain-containing protein n=1 Tax=Favolaschia claudopus TaxID=2862362 RepID=A0AAW0CGH9_9AGAR